MSEVKTIALVVAITLIVAIGEWVLMSAMEAKAYNRATGAEVTTWDAMWIELRVQVGPKITE